MSSRERLLYAVAIALALVAGIAIGQSRAASPSAPDPVTWAPVLTGTPRALGTAGVYEVAPRATTGVPSSPAVASEQPTPGVSVPDTTPTPTAGRPASGPSSSVTGTASWFCLAGRSACTRGYAPSAAVAAAGPALRSALGTGWRGRTVTVTAGGRAVRVALRDWCLCSGGKVIDLFASQFVQLAPLSRGVLTVKVSW